MKTVSAIGRIGADLLRALPVDLQQHVVPFGAQRLHLRAAGAVEVAEHFRVLEKLAPVDHLLELCAVDEAVVLAVRFAGPR